MKDAMNTQELGLLFGLSPPTIRALQKQGVIGKTGRLFDVAQTLTRYLAFLRQEHRAALKLPSLLPRDYVIHRLVRIDGALYETFETFAEVVDGRRVK